MFSKYFTLLSLAFLPLLSIAQSATHEQLLNEKRNAVENIMATFSGKPESFDELIKKGTEGLAITTDADYTYKFLFYQAIGSGYYYKQDFKSAKENFEAAYSIATKEKMIEKSTKPLGNLVSIYHYMGLQDKADSAAQQLKFIAETTDTLKNKSDIYYNLGLYNQQQKFYYSIALDNFLKSATLHKPIVDTAKAIKLKTDYGAKLMMVAEIYLYLKQPTKALQYLEETKPYLNLSKVINITAYGKFIRSYVLLNNKTEALRYYNLLNETVGTSPGKWSEMVSSNLEMASLALNEKDYPLAKSYIDKADKQSKLDNKEILTCSVNLSYGDYYRNIGDYKQALTYYKIAEHGAAIYSKEQYADLLKSLAAVQILAGNKEDAANTLSKFVALSDSLTQRKISSNLAEMEAVFQNKNKQQQIETKNIQLSTARTKQFWLIAGLVLLSIVAILMIAIYKNKKKTADILDGKNKKLSQLNDALEEANQTKAKLFSIISHDLRSPISQVYQFLKLQQLNPQALNEIQKNELSTKIQTATGSLLETMEDLLLWSKTQMNEFKPNIQPVDILSTIETCKGLLQLNSEAKKINYNQHINSSIVKTDQYFLQTIIRNLLQNAIKASPLNGPIEISCRQQNEHLFLSIKNSGGSFSQQLYEKAISNEENTASLNGLGLRLVDELTQKIGATISFSTPSATETVAELKLPAQ